jgi:hypothetical protein
MKENTLMRLISIKGRHALRELFNMIMVVEAAS